MASYGHHPATVPAHAQRPAPSHHAAGGAHAAPPQLPPQQQQHHHNHSHSHNHNPNHHHVVSAPAAPAGTFAPGTKIQVGNHRIVITKYLSEGGFAHVYLVKLSRAVDGTDVAVLKRVAVPDKDSLRGMRTEVETMKRLKGHKPIVTYIDSHASELRGGGYEVFLLMEYCDGGGLIDFMNTRLQHRLTEPEILNIFTDVAEGVACMHYLKPPLLHRDLKVENVLITTSPSSGRKKFKLCDFGSAAVPRPAPTTLAECRMVDEDVQKHTTLQYRSPEMVDVYRKQPLDEKSDIWALGVLLYKLCFYTTPFEDQGQLAILNASFRYPSYPVFSDRLKKLIGSMLRESQQARPNIYQVLRESCSMQGREIPIHDIYTGRSPPEAGKEQASAAPKSHTPPVVGAVFSSPAAQPQNVIPDVVPMRRGRPVASSSPSPAPAPPRHSAMSSAMSSPSPMRIAQGDPFAALDAKASATGGDDLSSRFPTIDQFTLLHDQGAPFDFDSPASLPLQRSQSSLGTTQKPTATDDAFAMSTSPPVARPESTRPKSVAVFGTPPVEQSAYKPPSAPPKAEMSRAQAIISNNPELQAISASKPPAYVSTGTMTIPTPPGHREPAPIYRFPDPLVHANLTRPLDADPSRHMRPKPSQGSMSRTSSFTSQPAFGHKPSSSRPSLEGGRPDDVPEPAPHHARYNERSRPASTVMDCSSEPEWLTSHRSGRPSPQLSSGGDSPPLVPINGSAIVESNVEFLRSMEESDPKRKGKVIKHGKRGSLSLSGTKNILAGKFGDAFKRFEGGNSQDKIPPARTPSPLKELDHRNLTPIAGSEATDGRSDDGKTEDGDDMTPEMRRDLERLQLSEEEKRVEAAQAEYRQRLAQMEAGPPSLPKSIGGVPRAVSIQNRVQSLLDEDQKSSGNVQRTAQGYGKYADAAASSTANSQDKKLPELPRKSANLATGSDALRAPAKPQSVMATGPEGVAPPPSLVKTTPSGKPPPPAPKKPVHLNSIPTGGRAVSPTKADLVPRPEGVGGDATAANNEYLKDFAKRFPSLGTIEMVERDLDSVERAAK